MSKHLDKPGLTRRQFLRGAGGALIALPALASLQPKRANATGIPPKRFIYFYHPNGVDTGTFWPAAGATEAQFTFGASQKDALEPFRSHILWLGGLNMNVAITGPGEQHQRGLGAALTGAAIDTGSFVGNDGTTAGWALGQSLDQTLVSLIGQSTPVSSLQLGVNTRMRDVSGVVAYAGARQPLLPENDPRQTYNTLFFGQTGAARDVSDFTALRRQSVLDGVSDQMRIFQRRVSKNDAQRLDQHLSMVRDLEKRLANLPSMPDSSAVPMSTAPSGPTGATGASGVAGPTGGTMGVPGPTGNATARTYEGCAASGAPDVTNPLFVDSMPQIAQLQLELAALALRCDLTRVVTILFSDAQDHIPMPFLNVADDIHSLSHMADGAPPRAGLIARDTWQTQQFAYMLGKLQSALDIDGSTVLDNSLLLWGSEVSIGNLHSHLNMPFVAAGHALGWRMSRYIQYNSRNHNDLLLSIAQGFGSAQTTFGNSAYSVGPLDNLL